MTQFMRPASNVTQTNYVGGYADIDESSASDSDYAYCDDSGGGTLEVKFGTPADTPGPGTSTLRYRVNKCNTTTGVAQSGGSDPTCSVYIYQGATLIASGTSSAVTSGPSWSARSDALDLSAITDWSDVRFRLVSSGGARPHTGVSWVELEVPDEAVAAGGWFEE